MSEKMSSFAVPPWMKHRRVTNLVLTLSVYDIRDNGKLKHREDFQFGDKDHRQIIGSITAWALDQGYSVETMAKAVFDAMPDEDK